jgi:hypothetical protein
MREPVTIEDKLSVTFSWPRLVAVALGAWLVISALVWTHTDAQMTNAVISGVLAIVIALTSTRLPFVRYLNAALGVWIFVSAFLLASGTIATAWNEIFDGISLVAVSLIRYGGRQEAMAAKSGHVSAT